VTRQPTLSKSRYISGAQCHLRLWYDCYERDLAAPPDEALRAVFDAGHEVGELACRRIPGGHLVAHDHCHIPEALDETSRVIESGSAPALFEAAFRHRGVLVRADIIERLPGGGWRLTEVKSTTRLKDLFVLDAAVQLWVLRGAGLDVREACVLTLDRAYVYDGRRLDPDALFRLHPVTDRAEALLATVEAGVHGMQAMLAAPAAPDIAPGDHCFDPYSCPYHGHCTRNDAPPDHGIDELPRLAKAERDRLDAGEIREIRDIPDRFPLTPLQRIVRRAVIDGRPALHGDIAGALARRRQPVRYLDFETFSPAIPRFAGTRPYDAIPFLFSVHAERRGAPPEHADYLHEGSDDPRPALTDRLIGALGRSGSVCAYSGYEGRILRDLAAALPERAAALRAIGARLFDLLPPIRGSYYHPAFRGSFSIKTVLPALVPGMDYADLSIADGQTAAARYLGALATDDPEERRRTFADLRAYCARDTLALAELSRSLATVGPENTVREPVPVRPA